MSIAILSIRVRHHMARARVVLVLHLFQSFHRLVDHSMARKGLPARLRNTSRRDLVHPSRRCTFLACRLVVRDVLIEHCTTSTRLAVSLAPAVSSTHVVFDLFNIARFLFANLVQVTLNTTGKHSVRHRKKKCLFSIHEGHRISFSQKTRLVYHE